MDLSYSKNFLRVTISDIYFASSQMTNTVTSLYSLDH